jgi:hypothetical protein
MEMKSRRVSFEITYLGMVMADIPDDTTTVRPLTEFMMQRSLPEAQTRSLFETGGWTSEKEVYTISTTIYEEKR